MLDVEDEKASKVFLCLFCGFEENKLGQDMGVERERLAISSFPFLLCVGNSYGTK